METLLAALVLVFAPGSDPIPPHKQETLEKLVERTRDFCQDRGGVERVTVKFYADRNHWNILFQCKEGRRK